MLQVCTRMIDLVILGIEYTCLAIFTLSILFSFRKRGLLKPLTMPLLLLGVLFLFNAIFEFSFASGTLLPIPGEVRLIHTSLLVALTLALSVIILRVTGYRDIAFLSAVYVLALCVVAFLFTYPYRDAQFLSYFFLTILFLHIELVPQKQFSSAGQFGMLFAGPAALLALGGFMERGIFAAVVTLFLFGFLHYLRRGLELSHATVVSGPMRHVSMLRFVRLLGFTLTFYLFVALAVIGLHELGHVAVARYYGCEYSKAVIYDVHDSPHAEISCSGPYNDTLLTLGGVIATTLVALLLLLIPSSSLIYSLSFFVLGLGLLISFSDFTYLSAASSFLALVHLVALSLVVLSVMEMASQFRTGMAAVEEHFSLLWGKPAEEKKKDRKKVAMKK